MAELNCSACEDIRQTSPEFIVNGLTDDICTSLANDTGLNPSNDHNDCTDLHNLNDCLVGNMATEVDAYDVCDWKEFMKNFIPNLWTTLKAMICALCGIWTNIHNIWSKIAEILNSIANINQSITNINNQIAVMPKDIIYADVAMVAVVQPGFPDGQVNRVNIPCWRTDGYIPKGIIGWNLSNYGSSTGVSNTYPFKVKLMGDYVSIQVTNKNDHNCTLLVEATVLYVKI